MPTYQYACTECGEQLEAVQSFSDPALTECPACQGKLRKVFNSVGIVFKGSGFYRNDSRSGNGGKSTTSPEPKSDAAKSDAPKSDSAKSSSDSSTSSTTSSASSSASTSAPAAASA
ncbi:FmdB family zinc ribbon protein [Krasilnikovia sp. MM14-A1004]|uniref:FmdB family zinc ribbon protein n=1 Tax=Krasilnikovia sp. MM14-A1004 TaxID=3373541 RepID=UPI00399D154F